ncbi:unnamed protein product [Schistosoma margrebowiei]|uniref:Uncharacterized protein n=1 Tax=Schistosoma margrebowiei TaxID=48269 RepID=A0A183LCY9_9TREM|nr:unnamed protein product [Schistosoma margrebowiei]
MDNNSKGIKKALTSMCQGVLGCKKHHKKEWIYIETLDKIEQRKNKDTAINNSQTKTGKVKAQTEYAKASKRVKWKI